MLALVTGATGFVGSQVVRVLLDTGHAVRVLHRTTSKMTALDGLTYQSAIGDVTDYDALLAACDGVDGVFHVAAVADYWRADKARMFAVNVDGTRLVLQAAREQGVKRVVFTSSAAAVGLPHDDTPADESVAFNLSPQQFPYGHSKVQAEAVVAEAVAGGQDVVTVNPTVIMGPGDLNMISGSFIVQVGRFQWLTPGTSGGIAVIDVRDVARMHLAAFERGRTGERYILNTANYTYREWFGMIADVIGVPAPKIYLPDLLLAPVAGAIDLARSIGINTPVDANQVRLGGRNVYFDAAKMRAELGTPQVDMRQSLEDTYRWYLENGYIQPDGLSKIVGRLGRVLRLQ